MGAVNPASENNFMNPSKRSIITVAFTVAIGGFLRSFDTTVSSGFVPFVKDSFNLTGISGDLQPGWVPFLSCGLPILVTLPFVVFVLRNQQQTAVILERLPRPQKRIPLAGTKE
jgi:hypothetical protein